MNLPELFAPSLKQASDAPVLEFGGQVFTFGRLDEDSDRLAAWLLAEGAQPGDRVAVYLKNSPALVLIYLAAAKTGFIFRPIHIL
jgi:acyl-coenzyme A synthetase/AMP-(fatty) acid ligase